MTKLPVVALLLVVSLTSQSFASPLPQDQQDLRQSSPQIEKENGQIFEKQAEALPSVDPQAHEEAKAEDRKQFASKRSGFGLGCGCECFPYLPPPYIDTKYYPVTTCCQASAQYTIPCPCPAPEVSCYTVPPCQQECPDICCKKTCCCAKPCIQQTEPYYQASVDYSGASVQTNMKRQLSKRSGCYPPRHSYPPCHDPSLPYPYYSQRKPYGSCWNYQNWSPCYPSSAYAHAYADIDKYDC